MIKINNSRNFISIFIQKLGMHVICKCALNLNKYGNLNFTLLAFTFVDITCLN